MICRHCESNTINRPRGLCWACYYTPGIRRLYPAKNPPSHAHKETVGPSRMPEPTRAIPGTEEKVKVLIERMASGQQLWHPEDATLGDLVHSPAPKGEDDEPDE